MRPEEGVDRLRDPEDGDDDADDAVRRLCFNNNKNKKDKKEKDKKGRGRNDKFTR